MNSYIVVLVLLVVAVIVMRNTLVRKRNAVENAFAGIDTQLMMRYDLIPNLVAVVKEYARHESETLRTLADLRAQAIRQGLGSNERVHLDNQINTGLAEILAVSENYPQLRATENFQQLQRALNEVEERIAASRRAFNAAVNDYNNAVGQFPLSIIATVMGFRSHAYFEASGAGQINADATAGSVL